MGLMSVSVDVQELYSQNSLRMITSFSMQSKWAEGDDFREWEKTLYGQNRLLWLFTFKFIVGLTVVHRAFAIAT